MKVFVISLPQDNERRIETIEYLERQGIDYEIFLGVDGRKIRRLGNPLIYSSRRYLVRHNILSKTTMFGSLTDGELGCAMSHLALYEKVISDGLPGAVVLEDDFLADYNLSLTFSRCVELRPDADVISGLIALGHGLRLRFFPDSVSLGGNMELVRDGIPGLDWFFNRRRRANPAACYYISNKACKRLVAIGYPVRFEADVLLGMVAYNKLKYFFVRPFLGECQRVMSCIGNHGGCKFY